ncbi:MAG TPA: pyridoxal-phosphate dependent enzyme [Kofleriaceae bacterium]|nr:pyridoxal-phosphate dependent enzyme [Kofleriaceae bacterium]
MQALARHVPRLAARIPWVSLGDWPTPLTSVLLEGAPVWIKNEGVSNPHYGGNKIRTLEVWFGHARERGAKRIWTIGAYGSNHAIATVLHAPTAGLEAGAIVFPQPASTWAVENCSALLASECPLIRLRSVAEVPFAGLWLARRDRDAIVMPPGGATPLGAFGAVSAVFELAEQIEAGLAPPPRRIVVAIGSTCTTAGLLAGIALAHAAGVWRWPAPTIHGVRVTPWPVTSRLRIAELAARTLAHAERLGGPRVRIGLDELYRRLVVDAKELGWGYGRPTQRALRAIETVSSIRLDGVYSAKAAAAMLRLHRAGEGPLLFWATKSATVLSSATLERLREAPPRIRRWLQNA